MAHLDEEEQVRVLALWSGTMTLLDVVLLNIDTLRWERAEIVCQSICSQIERFLLHMAEL